MSCNGCRVLRKGCSDGCVLRQCLRSIEGGDAQGHATAFVAKFFGRAAMMSFINAVPEHQRPALFQSLLYEACGRTVNPVHGSVGLLCSGNWHACQAAVSKILSGGSISGADSTPSLAASTSSWASPLTHYYTTLSPEFDFYASSSWPAADRVCPARASSSHPPSPNTDALHPLTLKRRRCCDPVSDANLKLPDGESLSPGSTDRQEWRIQPSCDDLRSSKQLNERLIYRHPTHHTNTKSLELTLSTPLSLPSQTRSTLPSTSWRSSHPPCISLESEGSVTSLDSNHLSNTTPSNSHKRVLDLLL